MRGNGKTKTEVKKRIARAALEDTLKVGELDYKQANAAKVARQVQVPEKTTRTLIRNDKELAELAEIEKNNLLKDIQMHRSSLSDLVGEKLGDKMARGKTSLAQAVMAYGLLTDKESVLLRDKTQKFQGNFFINWSRPSEKVEITKDS